MLGFRRMRPRLGLLGTFAVASAVPILLLGLVLSNVLRGEIRQRALGNARQSAVLLEQSLVLPQLAPGDLRVGLAPSRVRALDRLLRASVRGGEIARIKIWSLRAEAVYATDHSLIGKRFPPSEELRSALAGRTASEVSNLRAAENKGDRRFGRLLEVYTPLRFRPEGPVSGAFELYLPYLPVAATISHDSTRLTFILLAGLGLLYIVLFPIVGRAARRLRRQAADLKQQAGENEHLALHDALTDLPNRSLFRDRANQAVLAAKREQGHVGLMLLDLDRFKEINDTLGHQNGDRLLIEIGARLRSAIRESDSVARLGGDEFAVLLPTIRDAEAASHLAAQIRQALRAPLILEGIPLHIDASIGVAVYPDHGDDAESLLQRADVAMYVAKAEHSGCKLYSPLIDQYSPARLAYAGELRRALDQNEFVLHYQPKAELTGGRVTGVEALVRWQHPEHGLLPPDEFIPLAERIGLIRDLTRTVLEAAFVQLRQWRNEGIELTVAVNLSARDLLDLQLPAMINQLLSRHRLETGHLELEITESVIMADPMRARAILSRLDSMGIQLAIDDFGSGYSSLGYLKRLPVREIKIDRSFVSQMETNTNDAVIVRSTIDLAHNLGLRVVAEGVETQAIWEALTQLGCDQCQGYYLSRPLPPNDLAQWLGRRETRSHRLPDDHATNQPQGNLHQAAER